VFSVCGRKPGDHSLFYDGGNYNDPDYLYDYRYMCHYTYDGSRSIGYDPDFLNSISVLDSLPMITDVGTGDNMTYTVLVNYTTHSEMILKEPEYSPEYRTNNTQYDEANSSRFTLGDESLNVENYRGLSHYQVNAAAYIRLGLWFDYLREQGVYDNTRIIIVSDHGYDLGLKPDWSNDSVSAEVYNPVLMVKDFDAEGFTVSNEFMTNADTPFLAVTGLIEDPVNPFTGNPVDTSYKDDGEVTVFASHDFFIGDNNGTAFIPGPWYYVSDDMRDIDNWEYAGEW
ncbi:MAG: hypothetical protein J5883_04085, partial [Clostridiales bacterium]|nr:hypothetical protein [Clostridiales bacterium]